MSYREGPLTPGGFPYWEHPDRYCGNNPDRQSRGEPGHCEDCCSVGHIVAHPDLSCADVRCYSDHRSAGQAQTPDTPAATEKRELLRLITEARRELGLKGIELVETVNQQGKLLLETLADTTVHEMEPDDVVLIGGVSGDAQAVESFMDWAQREWPGRKIVCFGENIDVQLQREADRDPPTYDQVWDAIVAVRDAAERVHGDADTADIIDALVDAGFLRLRPEPGESR